MDEDTFRRELLAKGDQLLGVLEAGQQKPRIGKVTAVVFGVATFIATAFGIHYGYTTYQRYRLERTFGHYYASIGKEFLDKGQYQRALAAFDEANKLMPLDIDVYYDRVQA